MTDCYAVRRARDYYPGLRADHVHWLLGYSTYVNLERKYLYYQVPKAACTLMKALIHSLEQLPPIAPFTGQQPEVRRDMFIHVRNEFKMDSIVSFDDATQERILNDPGFFRFTVVRDPYRRLRSAWKDKVQACAPGYEYLYHRLKGRLPAGSDPGSFITFREFVAAIADDDLTACNPHWRVQVAQVLHPAMNFNFVGRVESLQQAIDTFTNKAGFARADVPPAVNASWGSDDYDQALADTVYGLYESDFKEFGYARDGWAAAGKPDAGTVSQATLLDEITERNIVIGHLYTERSALREQVRRPAADLDACRTSDFATLFERYIAPIDGWATQAELTRLYDLAKATKEGCVVEVGSYRGRSTAALAFGVNAGAAVPVYAVEPHEVFRGQFGGEYGPADRGWFMRNIADIGLHRHVRLINVSSEHLADGWPAPVGLLFIDGDHRYDSVKRDFDCWAPRLAPGAAVAFQDAANPAGGPGRLVRELVGSLAFAVAFIEGKMVCLRRTLGADAGPMRF